MYLAECTEDLRKAKLQKHYKETKLQKLLNDFVAHEQNIMELMDYKDSYKDVYTAAKTIHTAAKKYGYAVNTFVRNNRVFMYRLDSLDNANGISCPKKSEGRA